MARAKLLDLARSLKRRVELSDDSQWSVKAPNETVVPRSTAPAPAAPAGARNDAAGGLAAVAARIHACRLCPLGGQRLNAVPGVGAPAARVMFVGEGPGFDEDHKGEPFVGRSGQLLDKILESIGLSRRENAFIANAVKCHPMKDPSDPEARGNDRAPSPEEMAACRPFLDEQIRLIAPKVIVTLGASASRALLGEVSITAIRGQWKLYRPAGGGAPVKVLPTFHPAALLRNPTLKKDVWTDMKNLKKELSLP